MRVTNQSLYLPLQRNLNDLQYNINANNIRLSSGRDIINLADSPEKFVDVKRLNTKIQQTEKYHSIVQQAKLNMYKAEETITSIADYMTMARDKAIETMQSDVTALTSLGNYIKGFIEDIVRLANTDYNGKFLFAGTKNVPSLIGEDGERIEPFALVEGARTPENPGGLSISFNGNFKDIILDKSEFSQEVYNVKANELFGEGGVQAIQDMIDIYNHITFNPDGSPRTKEQGAYTPDDYQKLNSLQQKIADNYQRLTITNAKHGTKIDRLEAMSELMINEVIRLEEFRSIKEDTDVAKTAMDLRRDESALQYTLQVGARISQTTLFDFLR